MILQKKCMKKYYTIYTAIIIIIFVGLTTNIISSKTVFNEIDYYDKQDYPNTAEEGDEYND